MPLSRLQQTFIDALGLGPGADFDQVAFRTTPQWDSVGHMELILHLEQAFAVTIGDEDVLDLNSYRKAEEILARLGVDVKA